MTIGDRIKCEREKKNISQTDLAKAISVSKQTLYKYENNIITNIPSDKIEKISEILDITPTYIMGWNDDFYLGENLQQIFNILSQEFGVSANKLIRCFFTEDFSDLLPSKKVITLDNMRNALKKYFIKHSTEDLSLTSQESTLIEKYRILDPHGRDMVDTVLSKEYERCKAIIEEKEKAEIVELAQPVLNAAHTRTDIAESEKTDDLRQQEEEIMDDPDF